MNLKEGQIVKVSGTPKGDVLAKAASPKESFGSIEVQYFPNGMNAFRYLVPISRITPARVLNLAIAVKWLKMIKEGVKKEEYREYWDREEGKPKKGNIRAMVDNPSIFADADCFILNLDSMGGNVPENSIKAMRFRPYDLIRFHVCGREYFGKKNHYFRWNGCDIGIGKSEWGAPDYDVFRISIGEEVDL